MNLTIERTCEQCGGEMEILETDTLIECPWCDVRHFLETGHACYVLPHKKMAGELTYVPYLRIKGSLFTCDLAGVHHTIIDTTICAIKFNTLPPTLGLRPQVLTLKFATNDIKSTYLNHTMHRDKAVETAATVQQQQSDKTIHSEWIGETFSTIYQPLITHDSIVYDGVTGDKLAKTSIENDIFAPLRTDHLDWQINLLKTLCPNCGWEMDSETISVIHLCSNCDTAWRHEQGKFKQVSFATGLSKHHDAIHLPFWKMRVDLTGIKLQTLADFIEVTNIPRVIKPEWREGTFFFYCPAFKIRPKILLRLASQLTASQRPIEIELTLPKIATPVSLKAQEAKEAIKLILGHSAVAKRNIMPILSDIVISKVKTNLIFLPFFDNGYELCQEDLKIVINKQMLEWGKKL